MDKKKNTSKFWTILVIIALVVLAALTIINKTFLPQVLGFVSFIGLLVVIVLGIVRFIKKKK